MAQSERHQRFIDAVASLKLRFPNAEIEEKTGYGKSTVSAYLNDKEPSENFLKTFCERFGLSFAEIWSGPRHASEKLEPTPMQILSVLADAFKAQADLMKSMESKMALESSLQEVLAGVETIADRQGFAIQKILDDLAELKRRKNGP